MTGTPASLVLVLADHGEVAGTIAFVAPAFLVLGVIVAMRLRERKRDDPGSR